MDGDAEQSLLGAVFYSLTVVSLSCHGNVVESTNECGCTVAHTTESTWNLWLVCVCYTIMNLIIAVTPHHDPLIRD